MTLARGSSPRMNFLASHLACEVRLELGVNKLVVIYMGALSSPGGAKRNKPASRHVFSNLSAPPALSANTSSIRVEEIKS